MKLVNDKNEEIVIIYKAIACPNCGYIHYYGWNSDIQVFTCSQCRYLAKVYTG